MGSAYAAGTYHSTSRPVPAYNGMFGLWMPVNSNYGSCEGRRLGRVAELRQVPHVHPAKNSIDMRFAPEGAARGRWHSLGVEQVGDLLAA